MSNAVEVIREEVRRITGRKRHVGDSVFVCCTMPSHGHVDNTPSLSINITGDSVPPGTFYCFGCSASGSWKMLAKNYGLARLDDDDFKEYSVARVNRRETDEELIGRSDINNYNDSAKWLAHNTWRSMPGRVLRDLGVRLNYDARSCEPRVIIPAFIYGELVGLVYGLYNKKEDDERPSFVNARGGWAKKRGVIGFDYFKSQYKCARSVVLTEGPRDCIRLLSENIPAICILGAAQWNKEKADLVLSLGVDRVVLAFDSDAAGVAATKTVFNDLKNAVDTKVIRMKDLAAERGLKKLDPGNAPNDVVQIIRDQLLCD